MKKTLLLLIGTLGLTLIGCTQEEYAARQIVFAPDSLTLDGNGDIRELTFVATTAGKSQVTADADWIEVRTETVGQTLRTDLVAAYNPTGTARTCTLSITHNGAKKEVPLVQAPATTTEPFLKVGRVSNTMPNTGGTASIRILSNRKWAMVKADDAPWLTIEGDGTTGESSVIVNLRAEANPEIGVNRSTTLTVALEEYPDIRHEVVVAQNCYDNVMDLSDTRLSIGKEAGAQTTLTVRSTSAWELKDLPPWLRADRTAASAFMQKDTIGLTTTEANATGQDRSADIHFYDGTTVIATVRVTQGCESIAEFSLNAENIRVSTFQPGDGAIENLYDNDPSTYFTTYWNSYDVTVPQWITIDLGNEAVQKLSFQYQNRNKLDYVPARVLLQVTDKPPTGHVWQQEGDAYTDADRNWTTVAAYEGEEWCPIAARATSGVLVGTADKKYRYWRFYVEKAKQNPTYEEQYPDAFCFQISELKVLLYP